MVPDVRARSGAARRLLPVLLALLLAALGAAALAGGAAIALAAALEQGERLYRAGEYRRTVEVLEPAVQGSPASPGSAQGWLLLGKAYGRLAEREPWYRAVVLARRTGRALERAVELDPRHREALAALARFYEQAPAVVGGGAHKARPLRERLRRLGDS